MLPSLCLGAPPDGRSIPRAAPHWESPAPANDRGARAAQKRIRGTMAVAASPAGLSIAAWIHTAEENVPAISAKTARPPAFHVSRKCKRRTSAARQTPQAPSPSLHQNIRKLWGSCSLQLHNSLETASPRQPQGQLGTNRNAFYCVWLIRGKMRRLLRICPPNQPLPNLVRRCLHPRTVGLRPRHARLHCLQHCLGEYFPRFIPIRPLPLPARHPPHPPPPAPHH